MSQNLPLQAQVLLNTNHLVIRNGSYRKVNTAQKQIRPQQQYYNIDTPLKQTKNFESLSLRKPSPLENRNLKAISKNLQAHNYGEYLNNLNYETIKEREGNKLISLQIDEEQVYKQPKVIKHDQFDFGDEKYYKLETRSNDNSILERKHEISRCVTLDNNNISFQSSKIIEQNYLLREENHKNHIMMQQLIDIIEKQRQQDQLIIQQRPQNRAISTHIPSIIMNEFSNQNKRVSQADNELRKSVLNFKKPSAYHVPNLRPEKITKYLTDISDIKHVQHPKWDILEDRLPSMDLIVAPFSRKTRQSSQTTTKSYQIEENKEMSLTFGKQEKKPQIAYFNRIQPVQFPREIFPQNVQKVKRYMSKLNQSKV